MPAQWLQRKRRGAWLWRGPLMGLLAVAALGATAGRGTAGVPDVRPRRIALIQPGTVIGAQAPEGWTHLLIKSQPRAAEGDVDQLSADVRELSGLFFTALLARVEARDVRGQRRYFLATVASGLGTRIGDRDTIISPDTQEKLGANLGFLGRIALRKGYDRLQGVHVVARSESLALIDAPVMMLREGRHRPVVLRYAVVVDPPSGRLETLLWAISQDGRGMYRDILGVAEWLPPNKIEERILHVDANEFSLGLPTENALAMVRLYRGQKQLSFPEALKANAAKGRLTPAAAADLEAGLWGLMRSAATP
jgi:hypothetical protein